VAFVEAESMDAVQALHAAPQLWDRRFDDQVVMGRHQAVRVDDPVEAGHAVREEAKEGDAVQVVAVDVAAVDTERRDVKNTVRELRPELPCHGAERSARKQRSGRLGNVRSKLVSKDRSLSADAEGQTLVLWF
jgi:hypothetical protein